MRLKFSRNEKPRTIYVQRSFRTKEGKSTTKIVETLGTDEEICRKHGCADAVEWARAYVEGLNRKEKEGKRRLTAEFLPSERIKPDQESLYSGGDLMLLPLYNRLGLPEICEEIKEGTKAKYDLNEILEALVTLRILYPCSKLSSFELCKKRIRRTSFALEDVYRSLSLLSRHIDAVQAAVWKNSKKAMARNTKVIYYDCTNYFFEIEENDPDTVDPKSHKVAMGLRKRGKSKEHRPNPIVQMGMFMDGDGIPLAFTIFPGNESEQLSLQPLEEMMANQFGLNRFIISTDAGLGSESNRRYNMTEGREYIAVQSLPSLPEADLQRAISPQRWRIAFRDRNAGPLDPANPDREIFDLDELRQQKGAKSRLRGTRMYKEILVDKKHTKPNPAWAEAAKAQGKDEPVDAKGRSIPKTVTSTRSERVIVTYDHDFALYLKRKRDSRVAVAEKLAANKNLTSRQSQQDPRKYVKASYVTRDGEVAEHLEVHVNRQLIEEEAALDGFYAYATSLDDDAVDVLRARSFHYEIEHLFRTTKSLLDARPVYLSRPERIKSHFLICFLAMVILKMLQKQLDMPELSIDKLIATLRGWKYDYIGGCGYKPVFMRDSLTDRLQEVNGIVCDNQIITKRGMNSLYKTANLSQAKPSKAKQS